MGLMGGVYGGIWGYRRAGGRAGRPARPARGGAAHGALGGEPHRIEPAGGEGTGTARRDGGSHAARRREGGVRGALAVGTRSGDRSRDRRAACEVKVDSELVWFTVLGADTEVRAQSSVPAGSAPRSHIK